MYRGITSSTSFFVSSHLYPLHEYESSASSCTGPYYLPDLSVLSLRISLNPPSHPISIRLTLVKIMLSALDLILGFPRTNSTPLSASSYIRNSHYLPLTSSRKNYLSPKPDNSSNEMSHTTILGLRQELCNRVKPYILKLIRFYNM